MNETSIKGSVEAGLEGILLLIASWDWEMFFIWVICMFSDVVIAVMFACKNGQFESKRMKKGLYVKSAEMILLITLLLLQSILYSRGIPVPAGSTMILAFIFKDVGSILETFVDNHSKLPRAIVKWFKEVDINKEEEEGKDE